MNGSLKCPQFEKKFERKRTANFLLLPFTCESQSGPEKPDGKKYDFTLWQEFCSQCQGQIQMNITDKHKGI